MRIAKATPQHTSRRIQSHLNFEEMQRSKSRLRIKKITNIEAIDQAALLYLQEDANADDDETEDEAAALLMALQDQANQQMMDLLKQQQKGQVCIPQIPGEVMPPDSQLAPITSDYLIPHRSNYDNIVTALNSYISGDERDLKLEPVQTKTYNGQNGTGLLYLLQGSKVRQCIF